MTNKSIRLTREMIRKLMATEPLSTHALFKVAGADVNKVLSGIHAINIPQYADDKRKCCIVAI
jgi:hypothetical protein